ncbi:MAG: hypothetical protein FWD83_11045, partial [Promicromonosporaceae bacterium]|nr:hypothetical protein [Promicromonosporaceae bacterium]
GEAGAPYVYASSPVNDRSMQRFLARLGFGPAAGHRVVATPLLLRRLARDGLPSHRDLLKRIRRETPREDIDDLMARRRKAKEVGLPTGALDLRALQPGRK